MYFINLFKLYVDTRIFKGKICTEAAEVATLIFQTWFSNLILVIISLYDNHAIIIHTCIN